MSEAMQLASAAPPIEHLTTRLPEADFVALLRAEGEARYHDSHPFHLQMHAGGLSQRQIQAWVENRYYYQTRIPIKDALILAKSEDREFRRAWIRRIHDHDGSPESAGVSAANAEVREGGLAKWERLARGVGLDVERVRACTDVLPAVRFACDAYVAFVREHSLLECVASSLTEFFSPDIMAKRIVAWETHYPWVDKGTLDYFRGRVARAQVDSREALAYVLAHATTHAEQMACVAALIRKTEILWALLDAVALRFPT
jgi:pyrroloquinoline-quinone synthase